MVSAKAAAQKGTGAVVINFSVVDVVAARKLLESRGVVFSGPTQIIPGKVALAGFRDPDGNQLRLAGPPPKKVKGKSQTAEGEKRQDRKSLPLTCLLPVCLCLPST